MPSGVISIERGKTVKATESPAQTLWQVLVVPAAGQPDLDARRVANEIRELGMGVDVAGSARGYLVEGRLAQSDADRIARELLVDPVIETFGLADSSGRFVSNGSEWNRRSDTGAAVLLKPGVMDPVAQSVEQAIRQLGCDVGQVRTFRYYWFAGSDTRHAGGTRNLIAARVLANDAIEHVVWGPLQLDHLAHGATYRFEVVRKPIRTMTDSELERLSRDGQLSLTLVEMQTIQRHFRLIGRDPTDAELETVAQTWSEHCSHKTLRGRIDYEEFDSAGNVAHREHFDNLLRETIFKATRDLRAAMGPEHDWCVSVFEDNAGVVRFDEANNVCFKVETHNHPSAIEPYGGSNTGLGGVLRDSMGTGLGAKPVANTDVFCFAPPDLPPNRLPPGVLNPKRVMKGVVAGVRDYGNRMGIPTVNGAICFDERYAGNPLVFCGNVGLIPRDRSKKEPKPGDLIVAVGGRTGRDGIHGATFSSIELTHESEQLSGGAVQIGNAITQKMMLDVILQARDRGLYNAITDCGAGGFSSAVGEMGADIGADVRLDQVPLKYQGLSYTEIWISEAQERMVLAVPPDKWPEFERLCAGEGVEATTIGRFEPTGRLTLRYEDHVVGDIDMKFLHDGRPPVVRKAVWHRASEPASANSTGPVSTGASAASGAAPRQSAGATATLPPSDTPRFNAMLHRILSSWNVCSKEWVIRQYDHEVQGGSVIKPLVGAANDGPSDAAVIRPVLTSHRGLAIACGINPRYGDLDPYWMAASAIDEAIRNCVAVGADPDRIAILDNFCWGNTERPEELGKLVRAALACRDAALAFGTPFISGKDSLNNEFKVPRDWQHANPSEPAAGDRIVIPPTLLISALGQVDDVRRCVTMDLKEPGNLIYVVGDTKLELGGSHWEMHSGTRGGQVPAVEFGRARELFRRMHRAIQLGAVRSCHDLSEGGVAVALAEMAIAGGFGAAVDLPSVATLPLPPAFDDVEPRQIVALFSESNSRFLVEVERAWEADFVATLTTPVDRSISAPITLQRLGEVTQEALVVIRDASLDNGSATARTIVRDSIAALKESWQKPLRW
jgi:phosphoribosylformylglycinamidine synthase II